MINVDGKVLAIGLGMLLTAATCATGILYGMGHVRADFGAVEMSFGESTTPGGNVEAPHPPVINDEEGVIYIQPVEIKSSPRKPAAPSRVAPRAEKTFVCGPEWHESALGTHYQDCTWR